jgi:2,3-bisphosphoglycerate-independent phosphoglycerate mutase
MGGVLLITSSHAGCEEMRASDEGERTLAANHNPVPFHYIDYANGRVRLRETGSLEDIAPTLLATLELDTPSEMTGTDLRRL